MSRILGHTFLRSDWKAGDPIRAVANARQQRILANIWKHITVIGGRLIKPTDAEGKNWMLIFDGTSDEPYPPGMSPPWSFDHPFKCTPTSTANEMEVGTGWIMGAIYPTHYTAADKFNFATIGASGGNGDYVVFFIIEAVGADNTPGATLDSLDITLSWLSSADFASLGSNNALQPVYSFTWTDGVVTNARQELFSSFGVPGRHTMNLYQDSNGTITDEHEGWNASWNIGKTIASVTSSFP